MILLQGDIAQALWHAFLLHLEIRTTSRLCSEYNWYLSFKKDYLECLLSLVLTTWWWKRVLTPQIVSLWCHVYSWHHCNAHLLQRRQYSHLCLTANLLCHKYRDCRRTVWAWRIQSHQGWDIVSMKCHQIAKISFHHLCHWPFHVLCCWQYFWSGCCFHQQLVIEQAFLMM